MPPKHLDLNIAGSPRPGCQRQIEIFLSYCEKDIVLKQEFEEHLIRLKLQMGIAVWDHGNVTAGGTWEAEVNAHLHSADIILLLVSAAYMNSDSYEREMLPAKERHLAGEACVIPILLRSIDWSFEPLQVLPSNGRPIVLWENYDEALCNVACSLRKIVEEVM